MFKKDSKISYSSLSEAIRVSRKLNRKKKGLAKIDLITENTNKNLSIFFHQS